MCLGFSQALKVSSFDNYIKKYRIELAPIPVYLSERGRTSLSFSSIGTDLIVQINGSGLGSATINAGDELIFLFANGLSAQAKSIGLQTFEPGLQKPTYKHQYNLTIENVQDLSRYELVGMRKYNFMDFIDIPIEKQYRSKVQKLSTFFLTEIAKAGIIKTLKHIELQDVPQHIGDSVVFCSKVYNTRYFGASAKKPVVLDVQSDFLDPLVNVVILEEDRKKFAYAPEKILLNKDVCISGVVTTHNNVPYIFIHKQEQIKLKSPATLEDISLFVGDSVTVHGMVYTTRFFAETTNQPTVLNVGAPYPNQLLTVVIEKQLRDVLNEKPEILYLNKEISISGKVILYRNKPEIVIKDKNQLSIVNTQSSASTSAKDTSVHRQSNPASSSVYPTDSPAIFPGGAEGLSDFLKKNLVVPDQLITGESRTVVTSFYVNKDGTTTNYKINKSAGKAYDDEVLRVLGKMPRWMPRLKGGVAENVQVKLPITFQRIPSEERAF